MTKTDPDSNYRSIANASGFLFQRRVQHAVEASRGLRGACEVYAVEHPWEDPRNGASQFIDLVLRRGRFYFVVECKRVGEGGAWVFLPAGRVLERRHFRHFALMQPGRKETAGWIDSQLDPVSPEVAYCAIRGGKEERAPILERWASMLVRSLESFGGDLLAIGRGTDLAVPYRYHLVPVIVTNAKLVVCEYDAAAVSLDDGKLPPGAGRFTEVPWLRFRKTLGAKPPPTALASFDFLRDLNDRTVLIVHAVHLVETLAQWIFCEPED